jgi:hypothetical protein
VSAAIAINLWMRFARVRFSRRIGRKSPFRRRGELADVARASSTAAVWE